ncbi:YdcF family protein [Paenibacillus sp. N3.4]|uniref:YdcF family protein n=1 Tax=Paenibacillus sp. N3.4 TaxID=2603222 RepID=UPI0011C8BA63|nr:YdcF family protein [Paenibacillus sp. N3.4]TXK76346.1 YdcF family protein [Paenibacillus sp. N3.4]
MKKKLQTCLWAAAALFLIALLYFVLMSWKVNYTWKHSQGTPSDCLIILGAAVWDGKPSPALRERLDIAVEAYRRGLAPNIIASGGKSESEPSEAETMQKYLMEKGVPKEAILLEDQSRSTMENLENSQKIMKEKGFHKAVIVTHGFHAYRASLMAKSLGISSTVEPVQIRPRALTYYTLRECGGIAVFTLGRIGNLLE